MPDLPIRTDPCDLDFLSLGALVHRLDPGVIPFRKARSLDIHVSGGEYNVAANLSDCFGLRTGVATAMVRYPIGELVQGRVRETGVIPFYKWFDQGGVRWFHSGGIFAALSETTSELIIEGMRAAKAAGAVTSFDLNFRAKLWKVAGGEGRAVQTLRRIVEHVDCLIGNEEDLQKGLGLKGPEVAKKAESKLDPDVFFGM